MIGNIFDRTPAMPISWDEPFAFVETESTAELENRARRELVTARRVDGSPPARLGAMLYAQIDEAVSRRVPGGWQWQEPSDEDVEIASRRREAFRLQCEQRIAEQQRMTAARVAIGQDREVSEFDPTLHRALVFLDILSLRRPLYPSELLQRSQISEVLYRRR